MAQIAAKHTRKPTCR